MRIGVRTSRQWLENGGDDDFRFLKQIGVDYVDIELGMVAGYDETGCFTREALAALVERFAAAGLQIERANARNSSTWMPSSAGPTRPSSAITSAPWLNYWRKLACRYLVSSVSKPTTPGAVRQRVGRGRRGAAGTATTTSISPRKKQCRKRRGSRSPATSSGRT